MIVEKRDWPFHVITMSVFLPPTELEHEFGLSTQTPEARRLTIKRYVLRVTVVAIILSFTGTMVYLKHAN